MKMITTTEALAAFCAEAAKRPYVTVDTEFLRERTYWSKLCLLQMAYSDPDGGDAVLVDPLAEGLSLEPVYELFRNCLALSRSNQRSDFRVPCRRLEYQV